MSVEILSQAEEVAENLVKRLLDRPEQLELFEMPGNGYDQYRRERKEQLVAACAGKFVIDADIVDDFRYNAALLGAGFHPSQFEDVSYETLPAGFGTIYLGYGVGFSYGYAESRRITCSNRMRDEVSEDLFTELVPTTEYDNDFYITTPDDLKKIFVHDFTNLETCRRLDFDLLYERED